MERFWEVKGPEEEVAASLGVWGKVDIFDGV
jgi:hypothetical protein